MDTTQQILALISAALVLFLVAPNVISMNQARGTTLRNIAIWLLVIIVLVFVYQWMHPAAVTPELLPDGSPAAPSTGA